MTFSSPSLRHEIDLLTEQQKLPILLIMVAFWIVCAVEWTQRFIGAIPDPRFWTLLSLVITTYGGFQVFRLHRSRNLMPSGRSAEKNVQSVLQQIRGKGFVDFHNLQGHGRNIDHVVIGPSGIYAIETKIRSGSGTIEYRSDDELIFAGRIRDGLPLRHARGSADAIQFRLNAKGQDNYPVKPLVVFVGNWEINRHHGNLEVDVTTLDKLVEYFDLQKPELTGREISDISACFQGAAAA